MDSTSSIGNSDYQGESVPTYGQTSSEPEGANSLEGPSASSKEAAEPTPARWQYHNLDSSLLQFLCFLAEHGVSVTKFEDLERDENTKSESGTSMRVFRGRWKDKSAVFKYPVEAKMPVSADSSSNASEYHKRLQLYLKLQKDLTFEIQIMSHPQLREHRNIVNLLAVSFEDILIVHSPTDDSKSTENTLEVFLPILVVEPAILLYPTLQNYFDVHSRVGLQIDIAISLICDVAAGLAAIHLYGIVHGDVKDTNILLFEETSDGGTKLVAKLADFGASGIDASREDIRGKSPYWAAPEVLERKTGRLGLRQTPAADIYSFGILAATIASNGRPAFSHSADEYKMKFDNTAASHVKQQLKEHIQTLCVGSSQDKEIFFMSMETLVDRTLQKNATDRWGDLSHVPTIFARAPDYQFAKLKNTAVPFHSYGSYAHMGVRPLATKIADSIYDQLPVSIKRRFAEHVSRFKHASTDTQTIMVHLALKMKDDPSILPTPDDLVPYLLALRLDHSDPAEVFVPLEADYNDLSGFGQMYITDVVLGGKQEPPILKAVRCGNLDKVMEILSRDPSARGLVMGAGWNGLHYAAFFGKPECISIFLEEPHKLNINSPGGETHRYTPLHIASWEGNTRCVEILISCGANVHAKSMTTGDFRMTPLQLCTIQRYLSSAKKNDTIRLLLNAGASTNFRYMGLGITHVLAQYQSTADTLQVVLTHNPDLINQLTPSRQTLLHSAAGSRNLAAVELLVSSGAQVDAKNIVGDTPLHNAYMSIGPSTRESCTHYNEAFVQRLVGTVEDAEKIIHLLIKAGSDVDCLGMEGILWDTPEFRMYDEYEDASCCIISPSVELAKSGALCPKNWELRQWNGSDFNSCLIITPSEEKLRLSYDLPGITPNYYELQLRLAVLDTELKAVFLTAVIYRQNGDTAEVYMAARLPLHHLEIHQVYSLKLRDFYVKHKIDLKLDIYQEVTPGFAQEVPDSGRILLDWVKVEKFNVFTQVGQSILDILEDF